MSKANVERLRQYRESRCRFCMNPATSNFIGQIPLRACAEHEQAAIDFAEEVIAMQVKEHPFFKKNATLKELGQAYEKMTPPDEPKPPRGGFF